MLRRTCGMLLIGAALWSGLIDERSTMAEVGSVPQWIQLSNQIPDHRPVEVVGDKTAPRKPSQRPPYLQKTFDVFGPLKSATLELMADGEGVIAWIDDETVVSLRTAVPSRFIVAMNLPPVLTS